MSSKSSESSESSNEIEEKKTLPHTEEEEEEEKEEVKKEEKEEHSENDLLSEGENEAEKDDESLNIFNLIERIDRESAAQLSKSKYIYKKYHTIYLCIIYYYLLFIKTIFIF